MEGNILRAIQIFEKAEGLEKKELIAQLTAQLGAADLAKELYYFIPFAYCREVLPELSYLPIFTKVNTAGKYEIGSFIEHELYKVVEKVVEAKFNYGLSEEAILSVLFHSPEFKFVNRALHEGMSLEEIELSPPFFA